MTAQVGRTNSHFVGFFLDNSAGTLTDLTPHTKEVPEVGPEFETMDVTGLSDGAKNITVGIPAHPFSVVFQWDTVVITHLSALSPVTPLSVDIRYGVRHTWESGEPQYGISMSATSGFVLAGFKCNGVESITANFDVFGPTAPAFGTTAET